MQVFIVNTIVHASFTGDVLNDLLFWEIECSSTMTILDLKREILKKLGLPYFNENEFFIMKEWNNRSILRNNTRLNKNINFLCAGFTAYRNLWNRD